jgi:hypothetical protein
VRHGTVDARFVPLSFFIQSRIRVIGEAGTPTRDGRRGTSRSIVQFGRHLDVIARNSR